jgi:hypothetical protein
MYEILMHCRVVNWDLTEEKNESNRSGRSLTRQGDSALVTCVDSRNDGEAGDSVRLLELMGEGLFPTPSELVGKRIVEWMRKLKQSLPWILLHWRVPIAFLQFIFKMRRGVAVQSAVVKFIRDFHQKFIVAHGNQSKLVDLRTKTNCAVLSFFMEQEPNIT